MSLTKISDVAPGMEVASDVTDIKGNVLLKKGSTLSEVWIERLKKRVDCLAGELFLETLLSLA